MLIVEENKKFTEFDPVMFPYHECVVYITEPNFWCVFLRKRVFLFLKILHEDVGNCRRNRKARVAFYIKIMRFASRIYTTWLKSPGIFNEKRLLGKVIFIPEHSCLRGQYTWYSDFPTFRCPFCVQNVQAFEIRLGFHDDFLIRCESLSLEPSLEVWEQIIVVGDQVWRMMGEQPIRIVIGPIWPSLSRTCVTIHYRDDTERRRK